MNPITCGRWILWRSKIVSSLLPSNKPIWRHNVFAQFLKSESGYYWMRADRWIRFVHVTCRRGPKKNTFSCHKLLISTLNWGWKDSICQKLCRDLFYVGIIFFSQSLSKHHVVWENDSAKWNLAFSFEDTKETGWPSVREIGVKELANPIFALFKRSCRGK